MSAPSRVLLIRCFIGEGQYASFDRDTLVCIEVRGGGLKESAQCLQCLRVLENRFRHGQLEQSSGERRWYSAATLKQAFPEERAPHFSRENVKEAIDGRQITG